MRLKLCTCTETMSCPVFHRFDRIPQMIRMMMAINTFQIIQSHAREWLRATFGWNLYATEG